MTTYTIPKENWKTALANAINAAQDGDTIKVSTYEMFLFGMIAQQRMCPDKKLVFLVED